MTFSRRRFVTDLYAKKANYKTMGANEGTSIGLIFYVT